MFWSLEKSLVLGSHLTCTGVQIWQCIGSPSYLIPHTQWGRQWYIKINSTVGIKYFQSTATIVQYCSYQVCSEMALLYFTTFSMLFPSIVTTGNGHIWKHKFFKTLKLNLLLKRHPFSYLKKLTDQLSLVSSQSLHFAENFLKFQDFFSENYVKCAEFSGNQALGLAGFVSGLSLKSRLWPTTPCIFIPSEDRQSSNHQWLLWIKKSHIWSTPQVQNKCLLVFLSVRFCFILKSAGVMWKVKPHQLIVVTQVVQRWRWLSSTKSNFTMQPYLKTFAFEK